MKPQQLGGGNLLSKGRVKGSKTPDCCFSTLFFTFFIITTTTILGNRKAKKQYKELQGF